MYQFAIVNLFKFLVLFKIKIFVLQPTRDCVAKTLKRLEEKINERVSSLSLSADPTSLFDSSTNLSHEHGRPTYFYVRYLVKLLKPMVYFCRLTAFVFSATSIPPG